MKLGLTLGSGHAYANLDVAMVQEAERLGYDIVWASESHGLDVPTRLTWLGALTSRIRLGAGVMQMPARTPAATAMTAITLDQLSGGRFVLGLGVSSPRVAEGWHGVPFGRPLPVAREYIALVRQIFARQAPATLQGTHYRVPYDGPGATGLGRPLRSVAHGRAELPIFLGAMGPRNLALSAEVADGVLPHLFSPEHAELLLDPLRRGFAKAGAGKGFARFEIAVNVDVIPGPDLKACLNQVKPYIAQYVGGAGTQTLNFYNDNMRRCGYEEEAARIPALYAEGRKAEAAAAVPDGFVDEVTLCGPRERIRERLERYRPVPGLTLALRTPDLATVRMMAELAL
jgi:F420-dependent oxidoreductase-like protein